jgi:hypothetical protein
MGSSSALLSIAIAALCRVAVLAQQQGGVSWETAPECPDSGTGTAVDTQGAPGLLREGAMDGMRVRRSDVYGCDVLLLQRIAGSSQFAVVNCCENSTISDTLQGAVHAFHARGPVLLQYPSRLYLCLTCNSSLPQPTVPVTITTICNCHHFLMPSRSYLGLVQRPKLQIQ